MTARDQMLRTVYDARRRRIGYAVVAVVLAIQCVFPQPFVARAKLLPQDSSSAGLGQILNSLGGQLSSFANLLTGGRPPNDLYLIIGRSATVDGDVIRNLKLVGASGRYSTVEDAMVGLEKKVDVHLLLGGVLEIETRTRDGVESVRLTDAYVRAISNRIGALGRQTIARKAEIVQERMAQANQRVGESERRLDAFRRTNRLASPEVQLGSEISLRTELQGRLQAKLVELRTVQQTAGPENPALTSVQAEIAELRSQIARSERPALGAAGPNVSGLSELNSRYLNLFRDYRFAQSLYEVYARASEQVSVENMVAESATYIQVVEPAHLDPGRRYNIAPIALLAALVLMALFTEVYVPATGLRWPDVFGRSNPDDLVR